MLHASELTIYDLKFYLEIEIIIGLKTFSNQTRSKQHYNLCSSDILEKFQEILLERSVGEEETQRAQTNSHPRSFIFRDH